MKVNEELIRSLVEKVLAETSWQKPAQSESGGCGFEKTVDPSGVLSVRVPTVRLEPFEGRDDVRLKDVATLASAAASWSCATARILNGRSLTTNGTLYWRGGWRSA